MATEKATPVAATPAPTATPTSSSTRATKPRTARAQSVPDTPSAKTPARSARAKAKALKAAAIESALLEKEASKSLAAPKSAPRACCGQCGREMRFVPFTLSNLMCRSCYGLDRYRRPAAPSLSSLHAPRPGSR